MTTNAMGMLLGRVAAMGFGFVFWLVAAHVAAPSQVGFAAAVVAAMMLCTQFAQLGIGSAFIVLAPAHRSRPALLLDVSLTLTAVGSLLVALVVLVVARSWLPQLGRVATEPWWTAAFLAMSVLGTAGIVLDQVNVAFGRGFQVLTRTAAFGLLTLVPLAVLPMLGVHLDSLRLFGFWVLAGTGAMVVGLWQLRHTARAPGDLVDGYAAPYRYRPRWRRPLVRRMLTVGLANHVLTVCERVPGLVLPVVVTEVLSPAANAVWYIVWMSAWVVFTAPVSVGIALFAEATRRPEATAQATASAMRTSMLWSGAGAVMLALLASPVLHLVGRDYAAAGVTPLRLLLTGVVPLTVISAYYAQCRARNRLAEAIGAGTVAGVAGIVVPAVVSAHAGLDGMALSWVTVQTVVAVWAGFRLWRARE